MKVRIKKSPRTGDQRDYSLVTHRPWSPSNTEDPDAVRNTIGAVPRNEANIEAEGGETILGDINNDGNIEHMTITGKRHTQGGVPLNVPPGSFIFSDTKKMKIKDQAVLDHFGMGTKKGGYTPAEIAKRYQLNDFMKKVNDPTSDEFTRRTAERMLNNNMQKLAELAAYQEGMKGKGAPAVSQQMLPDGGQQMEEAAEPAMMQMMENEDLEMAYGGMIKMQAGGQPLLIPGYEFYIGSQKAKIKSIDNNFFDTDYVHLEKPINGVSKIPLEQFKKNFGSQTKIEIPTTVAAEFQYHPLTPTSKYYNTSSILFGNTPMRDTNDNALTVSGVGVFSPGIQFATDNDKFTVVNPRLKDESGNWRIQTKNSKGETIYFTPDQIREYKKSNQLGVIKNGVILPFGSTEPASTATNPAVTTSVIYDINGNKKEIPTGQQPPAGWSFNKPQVQKQTPVLNKAAASNPGGTPKTLPNKQSKVKVYESDEEALNDKWNELQDKAMGGQLYAEGGVTEPPKYKYDPAQRKMIPIMQNAGTTPTDTGENEYVEEYTLKDGSKRKRITKGNTIRIVDPANNNKIISEKKIEEDYNAYDPALIDQYKKEGVKITLPKKFENGYGMVQVPGRQGQQGKSGVYGTNNWWSGELKEDFERRFPKFMQLYPDFDPSKNLKDGRYQNWYNNNIEEVGKKLNWSPERIAEEKRKHGFVANSKDPNNLDEKFGEFSWSRPSYEVDEEPAKPATPAPVTVYRCPDCQPVQVEANYKIVEGSDFTSQSACQSMCAQNTKKVDPAPPIDNDFWIQNKLGIANAAMMDRFYGSPAMFQMNGSLYDPQLEEYSAKNASLQSDAALAMNNINASADPTVARANIAAIAGQLGQAGVNQIADIQNRNVGTTNAVAADRARLKNDFIGKNTAARKQFYDETINYGQNLVNSSNKQRTMMTNAFNNAFQGLQNRNMFRAIYPMYDINSVTGAHAFIQGEDPTEGAFQTTPSTTGGSLPALIQQYKDQFKGVLSPENAEKQAILLANKHLEATNASKLATQRAYLQHNPQAAMVGMSSGYNPFE